MQDKKHTSACHCGSLSRKLDLLVALQQFGVVEELQAEKKTLAVSVAERALLRNIGARRGHYRDRW
jgi:hypothetical protein